MDKEAPRPAPKGSQGAGGLHGRNPAHDEHGFFRHQRHRARHRLAAAPLARRVLRARPRQDALEREAAVLGARDSVPRVVARFRVRSEGHRVLPRRPAAQDAGDDPAEGARLYAGADPRRSSSRSITFHLEPSHVQFEVVPERCAAKWRASRSPTSRGKTHRRERQAHHRQAHPRHGSGGREAESPRRTSSCSGARLRTTSSTRRPARSSPTRTTRSPRRCSRSCARRESPRSRRCSPTTSTRGRTSRRRCAPTRPRTAPPRASRSTG